MALPPITINPSAAARAYAQTEAAGTVASGGPDFSDFLDRAIDSVVETGRAADARSMQAISGQGSLTEVVTAVSKAELALQTTVTIRDRVVQAYQDIMKMPI